ncbi:MAG: DUF711 family protein, partial [Desulfobacterales bacterium]|nr:DUF711 family protein [Desulfobacterales bacterium]
MLSQKEIISTIEMLRNEHLDVRTVTLGINLFDCVSHDLNILKNNIHKKIINTAGNLVKVCDRIGDKYGIPVVNTRIAVSPVSVFGAPFSASQLVEV